MTDFEVVILAAGDGKRMRSARPKVLHEVAGRPILAWVVEAARALEPAAIHVVHRGDAVRSGLEAVLGPDGSRDGAAGAPALRWVEQPQPLGTADAVAQALPRVVDARGVVLVLNGDGPDLDLDSLRALRSAAGPGRLALLTAVLDRPDGYGRVRRDSDGRVVGIVEESDASPAERAIREVYTGIMAAPVEALGRWLASTSDENAQGEYYLTDIVSMAVGDGFPVQPVTLASPGEVLGVNDRVELEAAERRLQRRRAAELMRGGSPSATRRASTSAGRWRRARMSSSTSAWCSKAGCGSVRARPSGLTPCSATRRSARGRRCCRIAWSTARR